MGSLIVLLILVVQQARVQADTLADQRRRAASSQDQSEQKKLAAGGRGLAVAARGPGTAAEPTDRTPGRRPAGTEPPGRTYPAAGAELAASAGRGCGNESPAAGHAARAFPPKRNSPACRRKSRPSGSNWSSSASSTPNSDRSFAIVPYQGPNGTRRRPIYIECRQSGITIQPEGIIFGPQDFTRAVGARKSVGRRLAGDSRALDAAGRRCGSGRALPAADRASGRRGRLLDGPRRDGRLGRRVRLRVGRRRNGTDFSARRSQSETVAAKYDPDRTGTASDPGGRHAQPL